MADQNGCKSECPLIFGNHPEDRILPDGILAGGRLVKENNLRIGNQCPAECHAFLHPPGYLRWIFVSDFRQFRLIKASHHFFIDFSFVHFCGLLERKRHIFKDRHGVEQGIVLEHVTDLIGVGVPSLLAHAPDILVVKHDPAFIRFQQSDNVFEQHTFTGAAFTDDGRYLAFVDLEVDPIENGPITKPLGNILKFD